MSISARLQHLLEQYGYLANGHFDQTEFEDFRQNHLGDVQFLLTGSAEDQAAYAALAANRFDEFQTLFSSPTTTDPQTTRSSGLLAGRHLQDLQIGPGDIEDLERLIQERRLNVTFFNRSDFYTYDDMNFDERVNFGDFGIARVVLNEDGRESEVTFDLEDPEQFLELRKLIEGDGIATLPPELLVAERARHDVSEAIRKQGEALGIDAATFAEDLTTIETHENRLSRLQERSVRLGEWEVRKTEYAQAHLSTYAEQLGYLRDLVETTSVDDFDEIVQNVGSQLLILEDQMAAVMNPWVAGPRFAEYAPLYLEGQSRGRSLPLLTSQNLTMSREALTADLEWARLDGDEVEILMLEGRLAQLEGTDDGDAKALGKFRQAEALLRAENPPNEWTTACLEEVGLAIEPLEKRFHVERLFGMVTLFEKMTEVFAIDDQARGNKKFSQVVIDFSYVASRILHYLEKGEGLTEALALVREQSGRAYKNFVSLLEKTGVNLVQVWDQLFYEDVESHQYVAGESSVITQALLQVGFYYVGQINEPGLQGRADATTRFWRRGSATAATQIVLMILRHPLLDMAMAVLSRAKREELSLQSKVMASQLLGISPGSTDQNLTHQVDFLADDLFLQILLETFLKRGGYESFLASGDPAITEGDVKEAWSLAQKLGQMKAFQMARQGCEAVWGIAKEAAIFAASAGVGTVLEQAAVRGGRYLLRAKGALGTYRQASFLGGLMRYGTVQGARLAIFTAGLTLTKEAIGAVLQGESFQEFLVELPEDYVHYLMMMGTARGIGGIFNATLGRWLRTSKRTARLRDADTRLAIPKTSLEQMAIRQRWIRGNPEMMIQDFTKFGRKLHEAISIAAQAAGWTMSQEALQELILVHDWYDGVIGRAVAKGGPQDMAFAAQMASNYANFAGMHIVSHYIMQLATKGRGASPFVLRRASAEEQEQLLRQRGPRRVFAPAYYDRGVGEGRFTPRFGGLLEHQQIAIYHHERAHHEFEALPYAQKLQVQRVFYKFAPQWRVIRDYVLEEDRSLRGRGQSALTILSEAMAHYQEIVKLMGSRGDDRLLNTDITFFENMETVLNSPEYRALRLTPDYDGPTDEAEESREPLLFSTAGTPRLSSLHQLRGDMESVARAGQGEIVLGRSEGNTHGIPFDRNVSWEHCRLVFSADDWFVLDGGAQGQPSRNGTFVNDVRVESTNPMQLRQGDTLILGAFSIRFDELPEVDVVAGARERTAGDRDFDELLRELAAAPAIEPPRVKKRTVPPVVGGRRRRPDVPGITRPDVPGITRPEVPGLTRPRIPELEGPPPDRDAVRQEILSRSVPLIEIPETNELMQQRLDEDLRQSESVEADNVPLISPKNPGSSLAFLICGVGGRWQIADVGKVTVSVYRSDPNIPRQVVHYGLTAHQPLELRRGDVIAFADGTAARFTPPFETYEQAGARAERRGGPKLITGLRANEMDINMGIRAASRLASEGRHLVVEFYLEPDQFSPRQARGLITEAMRREGSPYVIGYRLLRRSPPEVVEGRLFGEDLRRAVERRWRQENGMPEASRLMPMSRRVRSPVSRESPAVRPNPRAHRHGEPLQPEDLEALRASGVGHVYLGIDHRITGNRAEAVYQIIFDGENFFGRDLNGLEVTIVNQVGEILDQQTFPGPGIYGLRFQGTAEAFWIRIPGEPGEARFIGVPSGRSYSGEPMPADLRERLADIDVVTGAAEGVVLRSEEDRALASISLEGAQWVLRFRNRWVQVDRRSADPLWINRFSYRENPRVVQVVLQDGDVIHLPDGPNITWQAPF